MQPFLVFHKKFLEFDINLKGIKTGIIISKRVDGNLEKFFENQRTNKEIQDALIHISFLYQQSDSGHFPSVQDLS